MKKLNSNQLIIFFVAMAMAFSTLSCAKKESKIRGAKKEQQILNPQTTAQSIQQADNQSISYSLSSVSTPEDKGGGLNAVVSEILSRSNYIPIETTHSLNQDSYGVYDDTSQGTKLDIRARCIGAACETYVLLVTVVKNNYAYHQMAAISFSSDNFFYSEQRNYKVASMYKSVDEVLKAHADLQPGTN